MPTFLSMTVCSTLTSFLFLHRDPNMAVINEDEYSNSSRLHLSGDYHPSSYKSVSPSFDHINNSGGVNRKSTMGFGDYAITESPLPLLKQDRESYIKQLER